MKISRARDSIVAALRWHRRTLAALLAALAVLAILQVVRPAPAPTVEVVVAATDLQAGTKLTAEQVRIAHLPPSAVPAGAWRATDVAIGRVLLVDAPQGAMVLPSMTLTGHRSGNGQVLVPFRLSDPAIAGLLKVGDLVNVVATGADGTGVRLATRARVTALVTDPEQLGPLGASSGGDDGVIVVATDQASADKVAAASTSEGLSVTLASST